MVQRFDAQSPYGASYEVHTEAGKDRVRLMKETAGNFTRYTTAPDGDWFAVPVSWDGRVKESEKSAGKVIIALASQGGWSGGEVYRGYVFGQAGAIVWFACKSIQRWLVFGDDGPKWHETKPWLPPVEV